MGIFLKKGRLGGAKARMHLCIAGGDYTMILIGKRETCDRVPESEIGNLWPVSLEEEIRENVEK